MILDRGSISLMYFWTEEKLVIVAYQTVPSTFLRSRDNIGPFQPPLILIFSVNTNHESVAYRSFSPLEFKARGARKVTTGITGLWQPSVHSDVAF